MEWSASEVTRHGRLPMLMDYWDFSISQTALEETGRGSALFRPAACDSDRIIIGFIENSTPMYGQIMLKKISKPSIERFPMVAIAYRNLRDQIDRRQPSIK